MIVARNPRTFNTLPVIEFNRKRNNFELDNRPEGLEANMLKEGIQEFYEAETLAERIEAILDALYVYSGTKIKFIYNGLVINDKTIELFMVFLNMSLDIVEAELGDDSQYLDKIMDKAWDIVCEINAMKAAELDVNGKVIKQDDLPNATEKIAELLGSMLTDAGE